MNKTLDLIVEVVEKCQEFCDNEMLNVIVTHGDSFAWFDGTDVIKINFLGDIADGWFLKNALKSGLSYDCGDFILALFHEIGHRQTNNWLTKKENKACQKAKENLDGSKKKDQLRYFNILDEKMATDWAIDFINENQEKINQLVNIISPMMEEMNLEELIEIYDTMDEEEVNGEDLLTILESLS